MWKNFDRSLQLQELELIIGNLEFWMGLMDAMDILKPLIQIFLLVNRERHATVYLYEAMELIKDAIKRRVEDDEAKYVQVLSLFEERYQRIVNEVHAFAAVLNPSYMSRKNVTASSEIMKLEDYVERQLVKEKDRPAFMGDFTMYIRKGRSIFTEDATLVSNSMHPSWWRRHPHLEDSAPVLQKYAVAILSHPCSISFHGRLVDDFSME
ncbi:hypothetical protein Droror1_Dr00013810 [Drosera rotundifolia]